MTMVPHFCSRRVFTLIMLSALAACGGGSGTNTAGDVIRVDGSSTVFPITEAVAEEFQRARPGARVTVGVSGTGGGFEKFCRGETDISDASRPIRQTEIDACKTASIDYIEIPVAFDGLTVVVNPKNTWVTTMKVSELKKLWEPPAQGTIMRWNQIRPEWPDREIHLYGAGVDSGTFDYFTEAIVGKEDASRGDFTSSEDDNVLVQGIAGDELALGFFGFAYYIENKERLKPVAIDPEGAESAGPVLPSPETIRTGTYRPLSRPLFIYVSTRSFDRPEIQAFTTFYLDKADALSREVGYIPLTDREYMLARARVEKKVVGSVFDGRSAKPGVTLEVLLSGAPQ